MFNPTEYARAWRAAHKEHLSLYNRNRWRTKRRYQRRAKTLGTRQCMFCSVVLASEHVKVKQKKYCNNCRESTFVKRYLRNIYQKRCRQKKLGEPLKDIVFKE